MLESTPSLLTLGKRCKELGYRFLWEPFCDPKFYDPKGKSVKVDVINNIPYLSPSETEVVAQKSAGVGAELSTRLVFAAGSAGAGAATFVLSAGALGLMCL